VRRWAAGAALVTLGFLASPAAVPVYDGVNAPDEPYKHVGTSPAPVSATTSAPVTGGRSASLQLKTPENGPQVLVDLGSGAFSATSTTVSLTATPLAGDGALPRGDFDGNVYRITAGPGAALQPQTAQGFLFLRAAEMTNPAPVIVHRATATGAWAEVKTTRAGTDILSTPFRELGDYAVVRLPGAKALSSGGLSLVRVLLLAGGVLVLLTITVLVLRRPRTDED
jgi:hypothetical protein